LKEGVLTKIMSKIELSRRHEAKNLSLLLIFVPWS